MNKENSQDDSDKTEKASSNDNSESRPITEAKENPFSFKHFLRQETSSSTNNNTNGNESHLNDTRPAVSQLGARPKVPQYNSSSSSSSSMKRSPRFSSFDSQSSLSELAEERNMHSSRSNNSFNLNYQFPSSRSYSNYQLEPSSSQSSSSTIDRKQNISHMRRSQNNGSNATNNSLLPDFVQDHLVMESYYDDQNHENLSPLTNDEYNLDNCNSLNNQNSRNLPADCSLDIAFNRSPSSRRRGNVIPLDLPSLSNRSQRSRSSDLPPCDLMEGASADITVQREETYTAHNEPEITREQAAIDKMQKLPDFLSDSNIYSNSGRLADVANILEDNSNQPIILLQQENERLRQDLEESRRIILDLEQQINHTKNIETQYNITLAESMEQVEENLFACNQRATEAQAQAKKFKEQVKQLTLENQRLMRENETMRDGCGAVGGALPNSNVHKREHIARDLRVAASSAENNLRQLLAGVENLRLIANSIETASQFTSTNSDYLSDESDENEEGPAL